MRLLRNIFSVFCAGFIGDCKPLRKHWYDWNWLFPYVHTWVTFHYVNRSIRPYQHVAGQNKAKLCMINSKSTPFNVVLGEAKPRLCILGATARAYSRSGYLLFDYKTRLKKCSKTIWTKIWTFLIPPPPWWTVLLNRTY